jgi:hypothetical protein
MNRGTGWNIDQGQVVTRDDIRFRTGDNSVSNFHTERIQNVTLLSIRIMQPGDVSASVRIVLDCRNFGRNTVLGSFEVDNSKPPFMATASASDCDLSISAPSADSFFPDRQPF